MLLCKQIRPERGGIVYGVLVFDQFVGVVPAVEFAEFCTGFFELVGGFFFLHGIEVRAAYLVLKEPSWMSERTFFMAFLVSSVTILGPVM